MHGIQTSGNCIRNITSDSLAGIAPDEVVDPRPYCEILRQWSTLHPEFAFLPRKFKIAVTGAREDRAATPWHDIGLHLVKNAAGAVGFKVFVGGGMGRTPVIASLINAFVPWQQILVYIEAIVRVYNRYGRRDNSYKARIKILVKAEGQKFFDAVNAEFDAILSRDVDGDAQLITPAELDRVSASFQVPQAVKPVPGASSASASDDAPLAYTRWLRPQRAVAPHPRLPRGDAVAQARRPGAGRRHRRADGAGRGHRRAIQPRRVARHARAEPAAALGARERIVRALAGGQGGRLRHPQHRLHHRHDRLPRRRLLRPGQCALDPAGRADHRALRRPGRAGRHRRHRPAHQRLHEFLRPPPQRPHRRARRRQGRRGVVPAHARRRRRQPRQRRGGARQGGRAGVRGRRGRRRHRGRDRPPTAASAAPASASSTACGAWARHRFAAPPTRCAWPRPRPPDPSPGAPQ